MSVTFLDEVSEKSKLTAFISGEIDHHTAKGIRQEIDINLDKLKPNNLYLDFSKVDFMDSSGIGLVMGRYKLQTLRNANIYIQNPPPPIKKVMLVAGINRLAKIVNVDIVTPKNTTKPKEEFHAKVHDIEKDILKKEETSGGENDEK